MALLLRRMISAGLGVVLALAAAGRARAEEWDRARGDGLMLTAGLGNDYGGIGFEASYPLRIPATLWRAGPFVGAGWLWTDEQRRTVSVWSRNLPPRTISFGGSVESVHTHYSG